MAAAGSVMDWGREDVRAWLARIGLARYCCTLYTVLAGQDRSGQVLQHPVHCTGWPGLVWPGTAAPVLSFSMAWCAGTVACCATVTTWTVLPS